MIDTWSISEVQAIIESYFEMLQAELLDETYSKTDHARQLSPKLKNRSRGSIEFKHQNISAALIDLGFPYISGYKPRRNYQKLLRDEVSHYLKNNRQIAKLVQEDVNRQIIKLPTIEDILSILTAPPQRQVSLNKTSDVHSAPSYGRGDYLAQEARNISLGRKGEELTLNFEKARLLKSGAKVLADRIEHVAETVGDSAGFDIHSYESDGSDRLIEVKTTKYGQETPFYISTAEIRFSAQNDRHYHLYRLFEFRKNPGLFILHGDVNQQCRLEAASYIAYI
jgi:hypothetical protein